MKKLPLIKNFKDQANAQKTLCLLEGISPAQRVALKARTTITEDHAFVREIKSGQDHTLILADNEDVSTASAGISLVRRITSNISRNFNSRAHFMETFIPLMIDNEFFARRRERGDLIAQVTDEHKQALQKEILQSLLLLEPIIPQDRPFLVRIIGSSIDDEYAYGWHPDGDRTTERAVRCLDDRSTLIAYDACSFETAATMCVTAGQGLYVIRGDAWHATPGFEGERNCYTLDALSPR